MTEEVNLPVITKRKVVKISNSYFVSLPKEWVESNKLEDGEVIVVANKKINIAPFEKSLIEDLHKKLEEV